MEIEWKNRQEDMFDVAQRAGYIQPDIKNDTS